MEMAATFVPREESREAELRNAIPEAEKLHKDLLDAGFQKSGCVSGEMICLSAQGMAKNEKGEMCVKCKPKNNPNKEQARGCTKWRYIPVAPS